MTTNKTIRLGTRASQLALWQSHWVRAQLEQCGVTVELVEIRTEGDVATQPLAQIGGQGLFTKRLQVALLNHEIDLAVHSLKDLPTENHPRLRIAAIPPRETREDVLVSNRWTNVPTLPENSVIGTGSVRRAAQLLNLRADLKIIDIRGNVDTRLKKLDRGDYDAIVLAAAGLTRLGLADRIVYRFPPDELMPAVGQGALGLETRVDDPATIELVAPLNDPTSYFAAISERAMLRKLFAGCLSPVGADTQVVGDQLTLSGIVLSRDGQQKISATLSSDLSNAENLGVTVAEMLLEKGAGALLKRHE
jgi:hydroxymethylbilane synthase